MSRLETVRHELLALHRALLDAQRIAHELEHGKVTPGAFLELVIGAPEFVWLRPLTALIVGIDEALEDQNPDSPRARRLALIAAKRAALAASGEEVAVAPAALRDTSAGTSAGEAVGPTAANIEAILLADTRKLLTLGSAARSPAHDSLAMTTGEFQRRYASALHETPEIALAHASVLRALALPAAHPS